MRITMLVLMLIATGLGTVQAADNDMTIVGGLDFGFKRLHLDTGAGGNVFNPSFTTIIPNVAFGYKSLYGILSYDKSLSADKQTTDAAGVPTATTLDFSRTDSTATLGYRLGNSFSVFGGYTKGVNEFSQTSAVVFLIVTNITYAEAGPFVGVSYTQTFGNKGSLGLSVAYAQLNSELKTVTHPSGASSDTKGDNTGLSYGLTWSGTLTGSLGYRIGVKGIQYKMDEPAKITERYTNFFVGIANYF
jgi:hypothetical protein